MDLYVLLQHTIMQNLKSVDLDGLKLCKKKGGEKLEASHDHEIIFAFYNKLPKQQHIFQGSITPQSSVS
jgi:hypothetical protein